MVIMNLRGVTNLLKIKTLPMTTGAFFGMPQGRGRETRHGKRFSFFRGLRHGKPTN